MSRSQIFPDSVCLGRFFAPALFLLLLSFAGQAAAQQAGTTLQTWTASGPDGGDARALTAVPGDPSHLYLGTTNSWLYESTDSAATWHRLAKMPGSNSLVLDHLLVDPSN